jgi:hypothetical protein
MIFKLFTKLLQPGLLERSQTGTDSFKIILLGKENRTAI